MKKLFFTLCVLSLALGTSGTLYADNPPTNTRTINRNTPQIRNYAPNMIQKRK